MRKQSISYDLVFKVLCSVTSKAGSRGLALLASSLLLQAKNLNGSDEKTYAKDISKKLHNIALSCQLFVGLLLQFMCGILKIAI